MTSIIDTFALGGNQDEPAGKSRDVAALRERVAAICAEFAAMPPLPEGDAGIFEALRRLDLYELRDKALFADFDIMGELEDELLPMTDKVFNRLEDYVFDAKPETNRGRLAMLQRAVLEGYAFDPRQA